MTCYIIDRKQRRTQSTFAILDLTGNHAARPILYRKDVLQRDRRCGRKYRHKGELQDDSMHANLRTRILHEFHRGLNKETQFKNLTTRKPRSS